MPAGGVLRFNADAIRRAVKNLAVDRQKSVAVLVTYYHYQLIKTTLPSFLPSRRLARSLQTQFADGDDAENAQEVAP